MSKLKTAITRITDSISLKAKIQLIFFLFLIIPLLLFTLISYLKTNRLILSQTLSYMSQSYDECVSILDRYFLSMSNSMDNILSSEDIYQMAENGMHNPVLARQAQYHRLNQLFGYMKKVSDIDRIMLYLKSSTLYVQNEQSLLSLNAFENSEWYQSLLKQNKSRFWLPPGYITESDGRPSPYFSYVSILYSPQELTQPMGLMRVDISQNKITQILKDVPLSEDVTICLTDETASFFDRDGKAGDFSYADITDSSTSAGQHQWEFVAYRDEKYILRSESLIPSGWYLTAALPRHSIFSAQHQLYQDLLTGLFLIGVISYVLACITANSSLKRLYFLNKEIKKMEKGDFGIHLTPSGRDEIGEIMNSFLSMSRRMKEMIDERYEMGQAIKSAELNALQAQINPHFLYNSMDLINCIAIQNNVPQITEMVAALVRFYRLSLNSGNETVTLRQELMHVKTYIQIQNMRFEEKIYFSCNEEEWMDNCIIPKIILQPLAENAIIHGILENENQTGRIDIRFSREHSPSGKDEIYIRMKDDGVGMPPELLERILWEDCSHQGSGYGVKNVNVRLQLYFGPNYGLCYKSCQPGGTEVTVHIPAVTADADSETRKSSPM